MTFAEALGRRLAMARATIRDDAACQADRARVILAGFGELRLSEVGRPLPPVVAAIVRRLGVTDAEYLDLQQMIAREELRLSR